MSVTVSKITALLASAALVAWMPVAPARADNKLLKGIVIGAGAVIIANEISKQNKAKAAAAGNPAAAAEPDFSREEAALIQSELNQRGYNAGSVDGIVGKGTRAAVARYQVANGDTATGYLTPDQFSDLTGIVVASTMNGPIQDAPAVFDDAAFALCGNSAGGEQLDCACVASSTESYRSVVVAENLDAFRGVIDNNAATAASNLANLVKTEASQDQIDAAAAELITWRERQADPQTWAAEQITSNELMARALSDPICKSVPGARGYALQNCDPANVPAGKDATAWCGCVADEYARLWSDYPTSTFDATLGSALRVKATLACN